MRNNSVVYYLKYLDTILNQIFIRNHHEISIYDIFKSIYNHSVTSDEKLLLKLGNSYNISNIKDLTIEEFFNIHELLDYEYFNLSNALYYLKEEGYIEEISDKEFRITFKGVIQYSKGFLNDYKKETEEKIFNKTNIIIGQLIAIIALIISLVLDKG